VFHPLLPPELKDHVQAILSKEDKDRYSDAEEATRDIVATVKDTREITEGDEEDILEWVTEWYRYSYDPFSDADFVNDLREGR